MFIWTILLFKFWKFSIQHTYLDYTSIRNTRVPDIPHEDCDFLDVIPVPVEPQTEDLDDHVGEDWGGIAVKLLPLSLETSISSEVLLAELT